MKNQIVRTTTLLCVGIALTIGGGALMTGRGASADAGAKRASTDAGAKRAVRFIDTNIEQIKLLSHGFVKHNSVRYAERDVLTGKMIRIHFNYDTLFSSGETSWVDCHFDEEGRFKRVGDSSGNAFSATGFAVKIVLELMISELDPKEDRATIWTLHQLADRADAKGMLNFVLLASR